MITYDISSRIYKSDIIDRSLYFGGFSTRNIGDAKKKKDLIKFFQVQNIPYKTLVIPTQIHSDRIKIMSTIFNTEIEVVENTDAIVTNLSNIILTIVSADCSSTLYADNTSGVIGISHQGWRGTIKNLGSKVIDTMVIQGANRQNIRCALGPAIGACCYEIYGSRYETFYNEYSRFEKDTFHTVSKKRYLNLTRLNYLLLQEAGVKPEYIDYFPFCTRCNKEMFFSYQRDKTSKRMASFIMKK